MSNLDGHTGRALITAFLGVIAVTLAGEACGSAQAKGRGEDSAAPTVPPTLQQVEKCRAITDNPARLACYDTAVAGFQQALSAGQVVVVDRETVRKSQRNLFGFRVIGDPLVGEGQKPGESVSEVVSKVVSAKALRDNEWVFTIEGGAVWQTVGQGRQLFTEPEAGIAVTITRGMLGSYIASFDGDRGVKVKRIG